MINDEIEEQEDDLEIQKLKTLSQQANVQVE